MIEHVAPRVQVGERSYIYGEVLYDLRMSPYSLPQVS